MKYLNIFEIMVITIFKCKYVTINVCGSKKYRYVLGYRYWYGTTILRKEGYGYGRDIYFINFFNILLSKYFSFFDIYPYIFHILINICEFKSNYR